MKTAKKVFLAVLATLLFVVVAGTLFMFETTLKTKVVPTDKEDSYVYLFEHHYLKQWVDSLHQQSALKDTIITAIDGTKLHALYIKAAEETPNTALIIHGYTDNAIRMLMIGHLYNKELAYNILLPDLRAHGKSEGEYIQMGWKDRLDILQWIDITKQMYGDTINMVLHGISMGAATTMMTAGEDLPNNVKCFVEDCGYTSVWDEFSYKLENEFSIPPFPLLYTTSLYCDLRKGWNFKEASPLNQVKKSTKPMLFIHGDADTYIPVEMAHRLYEAKPGEKEIWIAPNSEHAKAYWDYTEEYVNKTRTFVSKYIDKQ